MKKFTVTLEFELKSSCDHGGVIMCLTWSDNLFLKKVLYFLDDPELVEICRHHTFIRGFIAHLRLLLQKCVHILCFEIERRGNGRLNLISMISFCIFFVCVCGKWGFRSDLKDLKEKNPMQKKALKTKKLLCCVLGIIQ